MIFYSNHYNGVTAIISEKDASLYGLIKQADGNPPKSPFVSVFTFCDAEIIKNYAPAKAVYTGTFENLDRLTEGDEVLLFSSYLNGWDGYVPFANGIDFSNEQELMYLTTLDDVFRVFFSEKDSVAEKDCEAVKNLK